ncbi:MAG: TetR/AcrR family transcriptional regulator [Gemmatimonadaceae bacterium]
MAKPRKPYHKPNLEAVLIETATALVAERGREGLSLRDLGKAAGVSRSAAYHYFADKNALLAKVGASGFAALGARIAAARPRDTSLESAAVAGLGAYVKFAHANPHLFRLMFANVLRRDLVSRDVGGPDGSFAFSSESAMQAFGGFVRAVEGAQAVGLLRAGDPLLIVNTLWAFAHGVAELSLGDNFKSAHSVDAILETGIPAILRHFSPPSRS